MNRFFALAAAVLAAAALHALSAAAPSAAPTAAPLPAVAPLPAEAAPAPKAYFDGRQAPAEAVLVSTPVAREGVQFAGEPSPSCRGGHCRPQPPTHAQPAPPGPVWQPARPARRPLRRWLFGRP